MDLTANKQDAIIIPITNTRISASEWNQIVAALMYLIVYAGLTPDAEDNQQLLTALLNIFSNKDLSNISDTGKSLISGLGMPSATLSNLTLGASGSTYLAPANGYFFLSKTLTNSQYIALTIPDIMSVVETSSGTQTPAIFIPVLKGQTVQANYTGSGAVSGFWFVYAEGAKQEA